MAHGSSGHGGGHGGGGALKEFFLALGLDADAASFASAEAAVHALEKGLELAFEAAEKMADAFVEAVVGTAEYSHATEHAAEVTGLTTDAVQEFGAISRVAGTSAETLQMGMVHLARSMAEARDGSTEAQLAFARLGVHVTDASGKLRPVEAVANDVADGLARIGKGADQQALAVKVFSRAGAELLPVLGKGSAGLRQQREEIEALGGVMSPEAIERGADFAKNLTKLQIAGQGLIHTFAEPLIEALNPLLDQLIEWVKENHELIQTKVQDFAHVLVKGINALASGVGSLVHLLDALVNNFWRVVAVMRIVAVVALPALIVFMSQYIGSVILAAGVTLEWLLDVLATGAALIFMGAEAAAAGLAAAAAWLAAAAPLLIVTVLVAGLILGFQDLFTFLKGGDSLIGSVLNRYADHIEVFWESLKSIVLPWWFTALFGNDAVDKLGLAVGDLIAGGGSVGGHVSEGASSPGASAGVASFIGGAIGTPIHAPLSVSIHASPGQDGAELADQFLQQLQQHFDQVLREAAANKKG